MTETTIALLGAGGQARETAEYVAALGKNIAFCCTPEKFRPSSFDYKFVAIEELIDEDKKYPVLCCVGAPQTKRALIDAWGATEFFTLIASDTYVAEDSHIGRGTTIAPGAVVTTGAHVGDHVLINVNATVSHDVNIGDYATIGPGVNIGGNASIGEGTVIGIGVSVLHGVSIGKHVYVGAGAVVTKDIPDNVVAYGVPAIVQRTRKGWIDEL